MNITLALIAAASAQDTTTRTLPATMPLLTINAGKADITIRHVSGAASSQISVTPTNWWEGCELAFSGSRTTAAMAFLEDGDTASRACAADIELTLAGNTDVEIILDRGSVQIDGMTGALIVNMGIGRVTGTPGSDATISLSRGRVELWDLTAPVDAAVKFGRIDLTYTKAITGTVAANVDIGRITTRFPYGTWLDTNVNSGIGRLVRTIPSRTTAATHLDAASRVGSIRVEAVVDEPEEAVSVAD